MKSSSGPYCYSLCLTLAMIVMLGTGCQKQQPPPPQAAPSAATPPVASQPVPAAPTAPAGASVQNPNSIQVGMSSEQVQQIMGPPAKTEQEGAMVEWKYYTQSGKVELKLQNNKVVAIERH